MERETCALQADCGGRRFRLISWHLKLWPCCPFLRPCCCPTARLAGAPPFLSVRCMQLLGIYSSTSCQPLLKSFSTRSAVSLAPMKHSGTPLPGRVEAPAK